MNYLNMRYPDGSKTEVGCLEDLIVYRDGDLIGSTADNAISLVSPKVLLVSCAFNCIPGGFEAPDHVNFSFTLRQAQASTRVEEQMQMDFQSTVTLRNF